MLMSIVGFFWYIILTIIEPQTKNLGFFYKKSKLFFFKLRIEWILVFSSVTSKNLATSKTKATIDQEIKKGPGQKLRQIG